MIFFFQIHKLVGTIALGLAGLVPYIFTMGRFDCSFWNSIATGFCGKKKEKESLLKINK